MTSPEESAQREQDKKIANRIRATPDRQLVNFVELSIELMNNGSFPMRSVGKVIKVAETLKHFKQGHAV